MKLIPLHKPYQAAASLEYLKEVLASGLLASGGKYSDECQNWFLNTLPANAVFLTSSCTDALEMSALLLNLQAGDEVILPSYTFVSTANAFHLRGCTLKFADSLSSNPNIGLETILPLVSAKTKAIVVMHYAGISVDMDPILSFARDKNIAIIEDAAQAIGAKYKGRWLGTLGNTGAISFHATKMISCGEGGCCLVNDESLTARAEIIFNKGTNRRAFQRHEVQKYEWQDVGCSYGMSELQAALLFSQLECFDAQLMHTTSLWIHYMYYLKTLAEEHKIRLPHVPAFAEINGTHFFIVVRDATTRDQLQNYLFKNKVETAFHYLALHRSPFYKNVFNQHLPNADAYESCLLRLPIHREVEIGDVERICELIYNYFKD